jgi:hypothetical protein
MYLITPNNDFVAIKEGKSNVIIPAVQAFSIDSDRP